ncbi:MAG: D-alanine--D-alanine ligase [Candidatus Gracilibacteria bacterium]|jgi:D-alanine-D-alanine ligase|nr:D-alanine--D-alanine ligase [Candidatus Gracilibacteria bacterium]
MSKIRVALFYGGKSLERDVSLKSGEAVKKALKNNPRFEVECFDPKTDLAQFIEKKDSFQVAFPVLHGKGGEDGSIQGFFELMDIPYVGSGIMASSIAINKALTKEALHSALLPMAEDIYIKKRHDNYLIIINAEEDDESEELDLVATNEQDMLEKATLFSQDFIKFPLVVKACTQGSSFGVFLCKNEAELQENIKKALEIDPEIIIEKFLKGTELTVGVIGNKNPIALEPIEIVANKGEFYDYASKYDQGGSTHIMPARISEEARELAKKYALITYDALDLRHMTRVDMFLCEDELYITEVNTIPGFTATSLLPDAAKHQDISFEKLCEKLVLWALDQEK